MEKNIVHHQLLMLKAHKQREKERDIREKQRITAISTNLDTLLATCSKDQRLPIQSILSLMDDSYCLKDGGDSLTLCMENFSNHKRDKDVWYSPPFYLEEVTGPKLRLSVYANGLGPRANTHTAFALQYLAKDSKVPDVTDTRQFIVTVSNVTFYCMWDIAGNYSEGLVGTFTEYVFVSHSLTQELLCNDDLTLKVTNCELISSRKIGSESVDIDTFDWL